MDSWIKFRIEEVHLNEIKYNSKEKRTFILFKNGDIIEITGSKAKEYYAKTQDIRRDLDK